MPAAVSRPLTFNGLAQSPARSAMKLSEDVSSSLLGLQQLEQVPLQC